MPKATDRLNQIGLKLTRASHHIDEVEKCVNEFHLTRPYSIGAKPHPSGKGVMYFLQRVTPAPEMLPAMVGDAIQCLVTTLDHLAWAVVNSDTLENPPNPGKVYFPVAGNVTSYMATRGEKLKGASAASLAAVDAVMPYKGGDDRIWELHELNRREKHRALLTVGSTTSGIDIGQYMEALLDSAQGSQQNKVATVPTTGPLSFMLKSKDDGKVGLYEGMEVFSDLSSNEPNLHFKFHFNVGLAEHQITHVNVSSALRGYHAAVKAVVENLKVFVRDTP